MATAEDLIIDELAKYQLTCRRFNKTEMFKRKTPDFRVFKGDELSFYCEVKEIVKDEWANGVRSDPIFNRLSDDIHAAAKQFVSVNPSQEYPNVLAFINNDKQCGYLDLIGVITGHLLLENNQSASIYLKYSEGRIVDDKFRIHLYLWFDAFTANKFLFNTLDHRHLDKLSTYFNINRNAIKNIDL
jgi:hypothetical protein